MTIAKIELFRDDKLCGQASQLRVTGFSMIGCFLHHRVKGDHAAVRFCTAERSNCSTGCLRLKLPATMLTNS